MQELASRVQLCTVGSLTRTARPCNASLQPPVGPAAPLPSPAPPRPRLHVPRCPPDTTVAYASPQWNMTPTSGVSPHRLICTSTLLPKMAVTCACRRGGQEGGREGGGTGQSSACSHQGGGPAASKTRRKYVQVLPRHWGCCLCYPTRRKQNMNRARGPRACPSTYTVSPTRVGLRKLIESMAAARQPGRKQAWFVWIVSATSTLMPLSICRPSRCCDMLWAGGRGVRQGHAATRPPTHPPTHPL